MKKVNPWNHTKRKKIVCDVCGYDNPKALEHHHIVERTEINTNNSDFNLAVLCANCHSLVHSGEIEIIGVFPSTSGKTLVYKKDGVCNVPGIEEAYYKPKNLSQRIVDKQETEIKEKE